VKLESKIASLEKTCQDLAKKVVTMDGSLRKLIKSSTEKITLDIQKLEQAHKTTKAYVEQKTCTAMEAIGQLGNAVHGTLENMMEVLDEVPQELRDALQDVAGGTGGEELESALEGIKRMQSRWADLANLVEGLIPKSTKLAAVSEAHRTPSPAQDPTLNIPAESPDAAPVVDTPKIVQPSIAPAVATADMVAPLQTPIAGEEQADIDMGDGEGVEDDEMQATGAVDDQPTPSEQDLGEESINAASEGAAGGETPTDMTVPNPASPQNDSPTKRKRDDDGEEAPAEKKKKKAAAPKKKGVRRKARAKNADADPTPAQDNEMDAEGEEDEA